jgi:thiosulfate dehydrogenase
MNMTVHKFQGNAYLILATFMSLVAAGCSDDNVTSPPTDPPGYVNANGIRGGQLFDKFWAAGTGWNQADSNLTTYNSKSDFFRCKQCHGWDRLGSAGAYISRAPSTTRPNVSPLDLGLIAGGKTPQELFDAMKSSIGRRGLAADLSTYNPTTNSTIGDQMPDYSAIFADADIWDLVKFLKKDAIDVSTLYDFLTTGTYPTGSIAYSNIGKDGNAANGDAIFTSKCTGCHGTDGRLILVDGASFTVGSFLRAKPNEGQHKIKFGQLGSAMGSQVTNNADMKDLYKALADSTKYPRP